MSKALTQKLSELRDAFDYRLYVLCARKPLQTERNVSSPVSSTNVAKKNNPVQGLNGVEELQSNNARFTLRKVFSFFLKR
jgi:hypothetical protein